MNSTGKNQNHSQKMIPDPSMCQIKRIENFSYVPNEEIGLGFSSKVYKGKNDQTSNIQK